MTTNQLQYHANLETARANKAREDETRRSNLAKEAETKRHNKWTEGTEVAKTALGKGGLGSIVQTVAGLIPGVSQAGKLVNTAGKILSIL